MKHSIVAGAALCIVSLICPGGARAEDELCGGSFRVRAGQQSQAYISTRAGRPCNMTYVTFGSSRASAGIAIVKRPRNGSASVSGTGFRYAPRPGFKGTDVMTLRFSWNGPPSNKLTSGLVTFDITVE
jgi:hypothetical protein